MDLILAIAALCTVPSGGGWLPVVDARQLECQQWYLACYERKRTASANSTMYTETVQAHAVHDLAMCVKERRTK